MKIKAKIVLFTCVLCILSIFLVSLVNYYFTAKELLNEIEENAKNTAKITAREIDQWLSIQKNSLKEIGDALIYNDEFEFDYVHKYLEKQGETNGENVYYLGFPNGSAIFGIDYIPPDDFDCTDRDWYIDAQTTDDVVMSSPYIDFRTGDITVTLSKAIKEGDRLVGVLGSDIFIDHLVEIISNLELGENSYGFLLDGEGIL
ncbi:cache domain-containing protein [Schnuerera sp.]|uniref:cache domain-containing protein n=1 Tax=Schnuerera sp. TaxID=2794844 RepID=UPI002B84CCC6|nr:cache domain-containing protein [Schnuerera sp.]HSH35712.1 cache domain-containing protein [Schnuerera sp.]